MREWSSLSLLLDQKEKCLKNLGLHLLGVSLEALQGPPTAPSLSLLPSPTPPPPVPPPPPPAPSRARPAPRPAGFQGRLVAPATVTRPLRAAGRTGSREPALGFGAGNWSPAWGKWEPGPRRRRGKEKRGEPEREGPERSERLREGEARHSRGSPGSGRGPGGRGSSPAAPPAGPTTRTVRGEAGGNPAGPGVSSEAARAQPWSGVPWWNGVLGRPRPRDPATPRPRVGAADRPGAAAADAQCSVCRQCH